MKNFKSIGIPFLALLLGLVLGRYTARPDKSTKVDVEKQTETHKVIVVEETPQGKKTTITEDTNTKLTKTVEKKVTGVKPKFNLSALAGVSSDNLKPAFGISTTAEVWGPITIGGWAVTSGPSGMIGLSIGVNF